MSAFLDGASYVLRGFRRLTDPRLRWFVLAPLAINVVLFAGAIYWSFNRFEDLLGWLTSWLPTWLDWVQWLLWPLFALTVLLVMFYSFTMIANIVGAPLNGLLAEKVELVSGAVMPADPGVKWWIEIPRAVAHEFHKWGYVIPRALPLLILFVVPGANVLAPFAWFLFGGWMLALEYADYPMGNHGLAFRRQRELLRERRLMALGFGCAVMTMTLIPILNFLSMPTAVIGATLMWSERLREPAGLPCVDANRRER